MQKVRLDNGAVVLVDRAGRLPLVAIQVWVDFGSADEPPHVAGIAHLIEHMLFKGIEGRPPGELARKVEGWGGLINAWTSYDHTVYHLVVPKRHYRKAMELLALSVHRPAFDPEELEREKLVVLEEIRQGKDSPGHLCAENLFRHAFRRHPYHRPIIGYSDRVRNVTREDVLSVHGTWYTPDRMVVVVAGDVNEAAATRTARRIFGALPGPTKSALAARTTRPPEPQQRSFRLATNPAPAQTCHFSVGFHVPAFLHPDTAALEVLAVLLGQGDSSRLSVELERKTALCAETFAYLYSPKDPGLLVLGGVTTQDRLLDSLTRVNGILVDLARGRITSSEVDKAKNIVLSDVLFDGETVQGLARRRGSYQTVAGDPEYESKYLDALRRVSPGQVAQVAAAYLNPGVATLSLVHPKEWQPSAEEIRESFTGGRQALHVSRPRFRKSPRGVYATTLPSGLRLAVLPDDTRPLAAVRVAWLGGSLAETAAKAGLTPLATEMLIRGTERRPGEALVEEADALGASLSPAPGRQSAGLLLEVPSDHLTLALDILADALFHSTFEPEDFERAKKVALDEIRTRQDDGLAVAMDEFRKILFGSRHPYGRPTIGTEETVSRLTARDARALHEALLRPQNTVVGIAGDVDPHLVAQAVERTFGFPTGGGAHVARPQPRYPKRPRRSVRTLERRQAQVVMGYAGVDLYHEDRYAIHVLTTVLGSQSGRLFVNLRDKLGLAYRVSATSMEGLVGGYVVAYLATEQARVEEAIAALRAELHRVVRDGLGDREVEEAKRHLAGSQLTALQRRASQARGMALNVLYGRPSDHHLQYVERVLDVTRQQVEACAQRYLRPDREILVLVRSPQAGGDQVAHGA